MPPFQRPCQPVANQVVEFEDDPTNLTTSGMITSQIKRRPAELSCTHTHTQFKRGLATDIIQEYLADVRI